MSYGVGGTDFPAGCAIVFGGSGGVGSGAAGLIAERGSDVVLTYNSAEENAEQILKDIRALGRRATALRCDVKNRSSVDSVLDAALSQFGSVHTIVDAHGGKYPNGPLAEARESDFREKMETDMIGFLHIAQASIPALRRRGGGSILAITSPIINRVVRNLGLAGVPKAAVGMMVRSLAVEEGRHNIRVNAISLGVIDTGMALALGAAPGGKAILEATVAATPLNRVGKAQEVAELIAFLVSAKSGYVTGQLIMIDGGFSL